MRLVTGLILTSLPLFGLLLWSPGKKESLPTQAKANVATNDSVAAPHLPAVFLENQGQWDGPASHVIQQGPMTTYVEDRGWTFTLSEQEKPRGNRQDKHYRPEE